MKIPNDPDDLEKAFRGEQAGKRGKGFLEITEIQENKRTTIVPEPIIPKSNLRHGAYYRGICRNATVARWNAHNQMFYHWRTKWGRTFTETICHREDEDGFDVFDAFQEMTDPPKEIPFEESK